MKGTLIECKAYGSISDYTHGTFSIVRRIIVNGLVITVVNDDIFVIYEEDYDISDSVTLGEVEVPGNLIKIAQQYVETKQQLSEVLGLLKQIMSKEV